jgi:hypothetical protein
MSGTLSRLKYLGKIRNSNGLWFANVNAPIDIIKSKIDELWSNDETDIPWFEGYISAMADIKFINDDTFDKLLNYIQNK